MTRKHVWMEDIAPATAGRAILVLVAHCWAKAPTVQQAYRRIQGVGGSSKHGALIYDVPVDASINQEGRCCYSEGDSPKLIRKWRPREVKHAKKC